MSNIHTSLTEEVELTLKLKVKITQAHHYNELSEEELKIKTDEAKSKLKNELLNMVVDEFYHQELTEDVSFDYTVENVE